MNQRLETRNQRPREALGLSHTVKIAFWYVLFASLIFALYLTNEPMRILIVGDSWAAECPKNLFPNAQLEKIACPGQPIPTIIKAIQASPNSTYDTVIILAGIANMGYLIGNDGKTNAEAINETEAMIENLADIANKKFSPKHQLVFSLSSMLVVLEDPRNHATSGPYPEFHLCERGYRVLFGLPVQ